MDKKTFSCLKCGTPFDVYPPDDYHDHASITGAELNKPVKMDYICKNQDCKKKNTLFWGRPKSAFDRVNSRTI